MVDDRRCLRHRGRGRFGPLLPICNFARFYATSKERNRGQTFNGGFSKGIIYFICTAFSLGFLFLTAAKVCLRPMWVVVQWVASLWFLKSRLYTKLRLFKVKFLLGHKLLYLKSRLYIKSRLIKSRLYCTVIMHYGIDWYTIKSRFNESQFNIKSRFKECNIVTEMKFHFKKSPFRVKSQFKESKCSDWGDSLNKT